MDYEFVGIVEAAWMTVKDGLVKEVKENVFQVAKEKVFFSKDGRFQCTCGYATEKKLCHHVLAVAFFKGLSNVDERVKELEERVWELQEYVEELENELEESEREKDKLNLEVSSLRWEKYELERKMRELEC